MFLHIIAVIWGLMLACGAVYLFMSAFVLWHYFRVHIDFDFFPIKNNIA